MSLQKLIDQVTALKNETVECTACNKQASLSHFVPQGEQPLAPEH